VINTDQKAHFDTFGYLMLPKLFSAEEIKEIREASVEIINQNHKPDSLDSDEGWSIGGFMERHPLLIKLLDDDRIHGIPEALLGPDFVLSMTDGHIRGGNTPWHGRNTSEELDDGNSYRFNCRVAFYFDTLNKDNGALRVIPGSHHRQFAERLSPLWDLNDDPTSSVFGITATDVPCVSLDTEPGDALVFTESVYHSSFGGKSRLQLTSQYIANPVTENHVNEIKEQADKWKWALHPAESAINSDMPRVQRMVSRLVELGCTPLKV